MEKDANILEFIGNKELGQNGIMLFADPFAVNSFIELVKFMVQKAAPQVRKIAFERAILKEDFTKESDVFFMKGAQYNDAERQTALKLANAGYFVVFPGRGQLKMIKQDAGDTDLKIADVFIYHKKSYKQYKADLKTSGNPSVQTVAEHISSGSEQASVVVLDITGKILKTDLITAIRSGWTKSLKTVLLNYKGQWYDVNRLRAFDKHWLKDHLK